MTTKVRFHRREFVADNLTPVGAYARLAQRSPTRFLFESITGGEQVSRYSFLGVGPREIYRVFDDRVDIERPQDGERRSVEGPPLATLGRLMAEFHAGPVELPFCGGFVGWFGFDTARLIERLPPPPPDPWGSDLPIAWLGRFDQVVVFDHARQRVVAIANEIEGELDSGRARQELDELSELLTVGESGGGLELPAEPAEPPPAKPSLDGREYRAAVEKAKKYIEAGDVFQVVVARRWRLEVPALEPLALYRAVRLINPSPYMVLLECPEAALVGSSPEMLVRKQGERIETRPIAGTRPRGATAEEDRALERELAADEKERAEHLMLVDLGRNDLGKVAATGSVEVESLMEVERYSHVMHLESGVAAKLAKGRDPLEAFLACFPAGTVSGAPKIRAMELIAELEPERRGAYAGAVGYFSHSGDFDTCITIRTLVVRGDEVSVTAGAGIVADSIPAAEEKETRDKAAALMAAVALARGLKESA